MGDNLVTLTFTKQKENAMPEPKAFTKLPIEMMTADMEHVSSIVLEFTADMPGQGAAGMSAGAQNIIKLIKKLAINGEIEWDILRKTYMSRFDTGNRDSTKRKFNRDMNGTIEDGLAQQENGLISIANEDIE